LWVHPHNYPHNPDSFCGTVVLAPSTHPRWRYTSTKSSTQSSLRYFNEIHRRCLQTQTHGKFVYDGVLPYYDEHGKRKFAHRERKTQYAAREAPRKLRNELEERGPKALENNVVTFAQLADYCEQKVYLEAEYNSAGEKLRGVRNASAYKSHLNHFPDFFGRKKLKDISIADVKDIAPIIVAVDTGARFGELIHLKKAQIDFTGSGTIYGLLNYKDLGGEKQTRNAKMTPRVCEALLDVIHNPPAKAFKVQRGKKPSEEMVFGISNNVRTAWAGRRSYSPRSTFP